MSKTIPKIQNESTVQGFEMGLIKVIHNMKSMMIRKFQQFDEFENAEDSSSIHSKRDSNEIC
jgi:hypothetical protein